jgi:hypothetical protein
MLFLYSIFSASSFRCFVKEGYVELVMFPTFINFVVAIQKLFSCTLPEISVCSQMWFDSPVCFLIYFFLIMLSHLCLLYCVCVNIWRYSEVFWSSFSISLFNMYSNISSFFALSAWPPCSVSWPVVMCHSSGLCYDTAHVSRTCPNHRMHRAWVFSLVGARSNTHFAPVLWYAVVDRHRQRKFSQKSICIFQHQLKTLSNVRN